MTIVSGSFTTSAQTSAALKTVRCEYNIITLSGTWTGAVIGEYRESETSSWTACDTQTSNGTLTCRTDLPQREYRLRSAMVSTGTINYRLESCDTQKSYNPEWADDRFQAQALNPTGAVGAPDRETDETKFPGSLLFDNETVEIIGVNEQVPHEWFEGTSLMPHIHCSKTTSAAGNVVWHLYYRKINLGVAASSWVGPIIGTLRQPELNTANVEVIYDFGDIPMEWKKASCNIAYKLYRKADDVGDTYGADMRLHEFDVHYQKNTNGSSAEYMKIIE